MQALPYLQLRESESPNSSEKKNYRLSLHETSTKAASHVNDGQTRSGSNVNRPDCSSESPTQFEESNSIIFGDAPPLRTPLPSPSPSKVLKQAPKIPVPSCHPEWVDPLGVWLTNRRACKNYETFTRHIKLLHRTSDMFLDPCPHIPRCSHERTLSALQRQRLRFKTEEEVKNRERHLRIILRVQQFRELWQQMTNKMKSAGEEHKRRLNSFKKSRERIERDKVIRLESEKRREEWLKKKRFRLPRIVVTYHEEDDEKSPRSRRSSNLREDQIKLPKLANVETGEGAESELMDEGSQGCEGDRLKIPEVERYCPDDFWDETQSNQYVEETDGVLSDHETSLGPENGSDSQENDVQDGMQNTALECVNKEEPETTTHEVGKENSLTDKPENGVNKNFETENENVVDRVLSEEGPENLSTTFETSKSENSLSWQDETTKTNESRILQPEQGESLEKLNEQYDTFARNVSENLVVREPEQEVKSNEVHSGKKRKEIQMNYLLPPSAKFVADENRSDFSGITEADDTASLMGAFIPIAMGVGNGIIPNEAMRASSVYDRYHMPSEARLNKTKQGKKAGAWKPKINDTKQYLQVDLGAVSSVTQVSTQGFPPVSGEKVQKKEKCWVESYTLAFSTNGSQWHQYDENGVVKVVAPVSENPSVVIELTVRGEKKTAKNKQNARKPKERKPEENEGKKKKRKKKNEEVKRKTSLAPSLTQVEEDEEDGRSSPEEGENKQEEIQIDSPTLPEIPKIPESVKQIVPDRKRSFIMFPERKDTKENLKPRRRRAETDQSIRNELSRQQLAEDRRKKLAAATEKPKREIRPLNLVHGKHGSNSCLDDFLTKYCILNDGQIKHFRRVFNNFDENQDGFLFPEELLGALESVNSNLLSDSHISYIYRVMELCDCNLESGADFKSFSVVAAFSQRLARLFSCYVDEAKKTISLEELILGLTAGGLTADQKEQTLKVLGKTASLDFLDFLTYMPLFIHIHDHIMQDPLGTVVYTDALTV
ncbi:Contactin-associated protein-like 5 [Acropora cervicornis]|uniref:Contactin-associated protein-like 5 n=1 Tax=Acropora cervicornis TaxID=6130 RepID=A0AAD9VFQ2_ACRCE|nr:Contactin-associated protein-like 5 [Acropora cervicornis]